MNRVELIKLKVKELLNEAAAGEHAPGSHWRERILVAALIAQAIALTAVVTAREPLYVGMDPYGNHVAAAPELPLTGKVYREVDYTPGTKLVPSQQELKERTTLEFRF